VVQDLDRPWHKYLFIILYVVSYVITLVPVGLYTAAIGKRESRRDGKLRLRFIYLCIYLFFIYLFMVYLTTLMM
jgi:hypothetical protein